MPRKPNDLKTVPIQISTTPPVERYLKELVSTGFYGKNNAEAAERLVAASIQNLVKDGTLVRQRRNQVR